MATAPQNVQQRLEHCGPLATTWAWEAANEVRETLQRNGEPDVNLSQNEGLVIATSRRALSSNGCQWSVPIPLLPHPRWEGEHAQHLQLRHDRRGGHCTDMVSPRFVALPDSVPLVCPQFHQSAEVEKRLAIAAILSQHVPKPSSMRAPLSWNPPQPSALTRARSRDASFATPPRAPCP